MARRRRKAPGGAFTLTELLAVIAIIGVLAAILIPTIGRVRESARAAQCASNLRQVGLAIQLFAGANRGRLPGPVYTAQGPRFTPGGPTSPGQLALYLEPYLSSIEGVTGSSTLRVQKMLSCPSWEAETPDPTGPSMQLNYSPWKENNVWIYPFGNAGASSDVDRVPRTVMSLAAFDFSKTWMLADVDKVWLKGATPAWVNQIPEKPVHRSGWNVLYYDGHVSRLALSER